MPAGIRAARQAVLRWWLIFAALISLAVGLSPMVPTPHAAADATLMADSSTSRAGSASPVTAYVVNPGLGTVSPIATATNTAGTPITVGSFPYAIAITPDGKTAYVANEGSGSVTPIATATNTAGRQ